MTWLWVILGGLAFLWFLPSLTSHPMVIGEMLAKIKPIMLKESLDE